MSFKKIDVIKYDYNLITIYTCPDSVPVCYGYSVILNFLPVNVYQKIS